MDAFNLNNKYISYTCLYKNNESWKKLIMYQWATDLLIGIIKSTQDYNLKGDDRFGRFKSNEKKT